MKYRDDKRSKDYDREAFVIPPGSVDETSSSVSKPVVYYCVTPIASIRFLWLFRRTEFLLGIALLFFFGLTVNGVVQSYNKKHGFKTHQFKRVYEDVKSPLELRLGDIDHWCWDGKDDTCPKCDDPTNPVSRSEVYGWKEAFMRNVEMSTEYAREFKEPDIIFLGDAFMEATAGTMKGVEDLPDAPMVKQLYEKKFSKTNGGKYDALRLGIAGDTSPNVLWRIKQNEMRGLTPKIWWVSVGKDDMFRTMCSEEVALIGIIRVIEELVNKKDGATIVINGLLHSVPAQETKFKSIQEVNRRLKRFAMKHHHVVFYDVNAVIPANKGESEDSPNYFTGNRLTYEGYKEVVQSQIEYIDVLMEKRKNSGEEGERLSKYSSQMSMEGSAEVDSSEVDSSEVDSSEVDTPQADTPQADTPQADTAQVDTPQVEEAPAEENGDDDYYKSYYSEFYYENGEDGDDLLGDFTFYGDDIWGVAP